MAEGGGSSLRAVTGVARTKFQQLAFTHAAMMGGEAAMVVALADSFFFDVDPSGARSRVLGFLLLSFAPFLLVAPAIGPAIDRVRGGRRLIVQGVAVARIALQLLMVQFADDIVLFPLVFLALVLQKTYIVSKSALVPAVVRNDAELVEANSKLGVIAGVAGAIAVLPAAVLQVAIGGRATLFYSAALFGVALYMSLGLPEELRVDDHEPSAATDVEQTVGLQLGWVVMILLRAGAGFVLFLLAFWFRGEPDEKQLLGLAIGLSALGTMAGNAIAPRLRRTLHEERMLVVALVVPAVFGVAATIVGSPGLGITVAVAVSFSAAVGRLSFESIVQRDGPHANRGQAFAQFETRFQLAWVIAAVLPVLLDLPAQAGFALLTTVFVAATVNYVIGIRAAG